MFDVGGAHALVDGSGVSDAAQDTGRHSLIGIQRDRIVAAITRVSVERGAARVTVADVVDSAGISRRTFYQVFADSEAALLAALDVGIERASRRAIPAYRSAGSWRERMRLSLRELLAFFDEEPEVARLLVVESPAAGPAGLKRRRRVVGQLVQAVEAGGERTAGKGRRGASAAPSALVAEGAVGGALAIVHTHICEDRPGSLSSLLNPLMSMIVLPYLGAAAARAEVEKQQPPPAVPAARAGGARDSINPLTRLPMRLTYRTVRVLRAIAESPGASNRQIGQAAGVFDQGQMSKLLRRLERLDLIANTAPGVMGAANQWRLQVAGEQLLRVTGSWSETAG